MYVSMLVMNRHGCTHTHTSPDPVGILQIAIYAQGVFHLNAWKMKIVYSTSCYHNNIVRGIGPNIAPPPVDQ